MKLFQWNQQELRYEKVSRNIISAFVLILTITTLILSIALSKTVYETVVVTQETKTLVLKEEYDFSEKILTDYIKSINIKFPKVVLAQAKLESSHFKSKVFLENNNLFGMKVASLRPTTAIGVNLNHAVYNNWRESVIDYALYQAAYLKNVKTEDEYYQYLEAHYAEDINYIKKLKQIVK
ncbi:MAG: glucosaminidase domain-containing protein [Candidatus Paceibacterota bacterium]